MHSTQMSEEDSKNLTHIAETIALDLWREAVVMASAEGYSLTDESMRRLQRAIRVAIHLEMKRSQMEKERGSNVSENS